MCEVRQALQRLRRLLAVQLRLNLANLLVGLGEELALQVIQFQIHHRLSASAALHAGCRACKAHGHRMISAMPVPVLLVPRAAFSIEDPWAIPPDCEVVPLLAA